MRTLIAGAATPLSRAHARQGVGLVQRPRDEGAVLVAGAATAVVE